MSPRAPPASHTECERSHTEYERRRSWSRQFNKGTRFIQKHEDAPLSGAVPGAAGPTPCKWSADELREGEPPLTGVPQGVPEQEAQLGMQSVAIRGN